MIPDDCKVGPGEEVMEIESDPDELGRVSFTMYWWGYNPSKGCESVRAQCFHALPECYLKPPEDSFAESGTSVNTVMVTLDK
jgi:hypothetical protein